VALDQLSFHHYVLRAFNRKVRVPLLGGIPLNKMFIGLTAVLGLANPGFWFLGAAGELGYLFFKANSTRFQKLIEGERLLKVQETWGEKINRGVDRLSLSSRERYRALLSKCRLTLGISDTLDGDSLGNFRDMRARSLNQLLAIFLRLLTSREMIQDNVEMLDRKALDREVAGLRKRLEEADEDSALERSLRGTIDIQLKRIENLDRAGRSLKVIDAELERIEQQVELIREESAVSGGPEVLSMRLDAVTDAMSETSRWMEEHNDFFHSLTGKHLMSELSELPDLPEMPEEKIPEDDFEALAE